MIKLIFLRQFAGAIANGPAANEFTLNGPQFTLNGLTFTLN